MLAARNFGSYSSTYKGCLRKLTETSVGSYDAARVESGRIAGPNI